DSTRLAAWALKELQESGVEVRLSTSALSLSRDTSRGVHVTTLDRNGNSGSLQCRYLFNCTYSGLNQLSGEFPGTKTRLKHEITEMALVTAPPALAGLGVTVMD